MLTTSVAIGWVLWRRHRLSLFLSVSLLLLGAAFSAALPAQFEPGTASGLGQLLLVLVICALPIYLLVPFTHGSEAGDVLARESCFPSHWYRLPASTAALTIWPLVYGTIAAVVMWPMIAWFILRPWMSALDTVVPLWWPGLYLAALLAWLQALLWMPWGLPMARLVVCGFAVPGVITLAGWSATSNIAEPMLCLLYAGMTVAAWPVSYFGVVRGRAGIVPDWRALYAPFIALLDWWQRRTRPFASAGHAQVWFEWRLNGKQLALLTAQLLILVLMPLRFARNDAITLEQTLLSALVTPVFLAGIFGVRGGGNNPGATGRITGIGTFSATLPLSTADMIGAMLKSAVLSTLAAWCIVAMMVPGAFWLSGHSIEWWQDAIRRYHPVQVIAGSVAVLMLLVIWTWKRQVDRLYYGLTGRPWVGYLMGTVGISAFVGFCVGVVFVYRRPHLYDDVLPHVPTVLGTLLILRLLLAGWALRELARRNFVQPATIARGVTIWLLVAALLFAVLALTIPTERLPIYYHFFAVMSALPMARLTMAPLVLAWNRHR